MDAPGILWSVLRGDVAAIKRYLAAGGDPECSASGELEEVDRRLASENEGYELGRLLSFGVRMRNPVVFACFALQPAALEPLLAAGGNPDCPTGAYSLLSQMVGRRNGPIFSTAERDTMVAVIKALIDGGADVNHGRDTGVPPLVECAIWNDSEVALVLLARGADLNIQDLDGETALTMALVEGHRQFVDLLLSHGARTDIPNRHGKTPQTIAWELGVPLRRTPH